MPRLTANTIVVHPDSGQPVLLAADGDLPDWAAELVGGHLLDGKKPTRQQDATDSRLPSSVPARSGPGSSAERWRSYAAEQGVEVPADAERPAVIAALEAAGKPTK